MQRIVEPLCLWYQERKRDLPWRKDQDPYHIWISEIMLQQTRVEAVKGYYERFMKELPNVHALANVTEEKLLKLWEGLGYYSRARNLKKAAQMIEQEYDGVFPCSYQELLNLPGIGEYTAGAIASIAFRKKVPAIDGNVFRVMMRIQNSKQNISKPKTRKELFSALLEIMPDDPGTFNQALMELGATVCVPNGAPDCMHCPVESICRAHMEHTELELPIKDMKAEKKQEEYTVFILLDFNQVAIRKRKKNGLLASLYEFPNVPYNLTKEEALKYLKQAGYSVFRILEVPSSKHVFTHKIWKMTNYVVYVEEKDSDNIWIDIHTLLENYALPSAFKKQLQILKEEVKKH